MSMYVENGKKVWRQDSKNGKFIIYSLKTIQDEAREALKRGGIGLNTVDILCVVPLHRT